MKKIILVAIILVVSTFTFAETNANDTQSVIVNSLLIQQLMQMQNQNQANQSQIQQNAEQKETKKKKRIEDEDDLLDAGFKRFRFDEDAEDYIVFKPATSEYEIEIYAVSKRNKLSYFGSILVDGKKGYKGNPLDEDLDNYRCVYFKVTNDDQAIIKNLGEKHSDQYFEIQ